MRDMTLESPGVSFASTTDYVNWKDTHRITCGFGYKYEGWNFDLAYQYSNTKGVFSPFQPGLTYTLEELVDGAYVDVPYTNNPPTTDVSNKRHQIMATVGYTF